MKTSSSPPPPSSSSYRHHPSLVKERRAIKFSSEKMSVVLFGQENLSKFGKLRSLLAKNEEFDGQSLWWISGQQRYTRACRQAAEFIRIVRTHNLMADPDCINSMMVLAGEDFFVHVHLAMFVPSIENFADAEQKSWWLDRARNFNILGTYAQTEYGHGSNVPGLETVADFDESTDEWILNTPTLTATKCWSGGLAKSCNHCILMARLRTRGKDQGVHPFMLQIRDLKTHASLPGIVLNHMGQKLGYNGMDNGTMQLNNARIPRRNLFMRFCSVDAQGNYARRGAQKLLYAIMTFTRKQIIMNAGVALMKNCVIATRYSVVRRQFPDSSLELPKDLLAINKLPESPVIDYSTQQYALFPMVATSVAYWFTSDIVAPLYDRVMVECNNNDFTRLSDIHAITSALKATMTYTVMEGIEVCRKACGGHGYALSAGIPLHLTNYAPQATYEGDFVVLSIQAGRILLKAVESKMSGAEVARLSELSFRYLFDFDPFHSRDAEVAGAAQRLLDVHWQISAYKQRSCVLTYKAAQAFAGALGQGMTNLQALDEIKIELMRVTTAYANVIILECFKKRLEMVGNAFPVELAVLDILRNLFALHWMERQFGEFVVAGVVAADDYDILMQKIKSLLKEFRPHALGVVDSVGMPDYLLNSVLGRYDGQVYEAMHKGMLHDPLNDTDVSDGYYRHLQFVLHPERTAAKL
eukprot:GHVS01069221.1.p1 GENE.GHVS01069221.1~~GHVS01069221.1.p1  ORF type:complete len:710 (+),score=105.82 GHVS01069221.1:42-2132(+)